MTTGINRNQMALLMIAGIPVMIILASTWLWYYVASGRLDLVGVLGTANRGTLVSPPLAIADFAPVDALGRAFEPRDDRPLWRIVIPGGAHCDAGCEELLYYTRQIHTAMGKYANRIQRVYLAQDAAPGDSGLENLKQGYPGINLLYTSAPAITAARSADIAGQTGQGSKPGYYVMDPSGWLILSYAADADGKDVMADLKFLLKNSNG
ncbi:MAG: hypothetical protein AAGI24_15715 [Pseudomonadota bacterium]